MKFVNRFLIFLLICIAVLFMVTSCTKKEEKIFIPGQFNPDLTYGTMTDIDGNVYKTIVVGTQTWMAENLKVTKYRTGEDIPVITDDMEWDSLTSGAYCNPNFFSGSATGYGLLYNWYSVNDSRNIAPSGWHVPTHSEWIILSEYLGGKNIAGGKLKESGTVHWKSPNNDATNETGFTALPSGCRNSDGYFSEMGTYAYFWTSTEANASLAWFRYLNYYYPKVQESYSYGKSCGFSVRCIKDN